VSRVLHERVSFLGMRQDANKRVRGRSMARARRGTIFSSEVLSQIAKFVEQGCSAAEIAEKLGCKLGSLRVKCSQHGISLRRWQTNSRDKNSHATIMIHLRTSTASLLKRTAQRQGTTGPRLAAALLEAVVQDNLYDAVIDRETVVRARPGIRRPAEATAEVDRDAGRKVLTGTS